MRTFCICRDIHQIAYPYRITDHTRYPLIRLNSAAALPIIYMRLKIPIHLPMANTEHMRADCAHGIDIPILVQELGFIENLTLNAAMLFHCAFHRIRMVLRRAC